MRVEGTAAVVGFNMSMCVLFMSIAWSCTTEITSGAEVRMERMRIEAECPAKPATP